MALTFISLALAAAGLGFAAWLYLALKKQKVTDEVAAKTAGFIREGAMTFLIKQYKILAGLIVAFTLIIGFTPLLSWKLALAFAIGAIFSVLSGFIGVRVATLANVRTAEKCRDHLLLGLRTAFSAGSVMGLAVVGLGLIGVAVLYLIFDDPTITYGFGFGASLIALLARVGGGIYAKAADMGADLAGKIEADLAEDDWRNPAVMASVVGDNVGDVAGAGADFFESYVDAIIVASAAGLAALPFFGSAAVALPMLLAGLGIVSAIFGQAITRFLTAAPARLLSIGVGLAALFMAVISFFAVKLIIGDVNVFWALISGLIGGIIIGLVAEYYTSKKNKPVRDVAEAAQTGAATNIVSGLSLGMISTIVPAMAVLAVIYSASHLAGIYGIGLAAVGMLSTLGIVLAVSAFGPVADNAASIAQMAGLDSDTKKRAAELDAVGNAKASLGKGLAIGGAVLTALALLMAFGAMIDLRFVNLLETKVIIGLVLGGLLPFVFCALVMKAVGRAAQKMAAEVRRQFSEIAGLMSGQVGPDYKSCVSIATGAALSRMIAPGLLAVLAPVLVGWFLGAAALAGLLAGSIVVGFLLAVFMTNSGGALDNAKKLIEADNFGGQGSEPHKAAIVGDTVGDSLKDAAGPALNILIKLMAIISIIIVPIIMMR